MLVSGSFYKFLDLWPKTNQSLRKKKLFTTWLWCCVLTPFQDRQFQVHFGSNEPWVFKVWKVLMLDMRAGENDDKVVLQNVGVFFLFALSKNEVFKTFWMMSPRLEWSKNR